jgi:hypothetical protein
VSIPKAETMKVLVLILLCSLAACVTTERKRNEKVNNQLQIQEDVERFYTRFTERVVNALLENEMLVNQYELEGIKEYTLYDTEALKIATAPFPIVNLLDMIVFIKLNKAVVKSHWIPKLLGEEGIALLNAFEASEKDIINISSKHLTDDDLGEIDQLVKEWSKENPGQFRVEKIRFSDFSKFAKDAGQGNTFALSKMAVNTDNAVNAADHMILIANRGLFLAQQMPFILRLQSRIGVQDILRDSISTMQSAPQLIKGINETRPLVNDLITLTTEIDHLAKDSKVVLETIHILIKKIFKRII